MPILNVIDHSEFSNVAIIIVRYFGGTKLGTGGLARAYSLAAKTVLETTAWTIYEAKQNIELVCDFHQEHQLRYLITQIDGEIVNVDYQQQVYLKVRLPENADLSSLTLYRIDRGDD
jgi:putative IMPACT (imprinted ancient) family translation regulator